ncbi:hypothetical protein LSTR_LSTR007886 [Laodelphax striatellus]|uniref:Uncharacterized protein n=1 Tax=Laodelphax striatellus TaxID=195883 RepID=A0A482XR01_LAOST|nr:hypothetical protein LSTR_LSTR007886 [Laodelphax striatellus]
MAALLSSSYVFLMVLAVGLAAPPKTAVVYQQLGSTPAANPPPQKKVTIGDPQTTVTTMTGGVAGLQEVLFKV